jgi:phenylalanyl-tRNA synthetase beta subunit
VRSATLFDVYRPKDRAAEAAAGMAAAGEKSLAVRLVLLAATTRTLTDERIDAAVQAVLAGCSPAWVRACALMAE